LHGLNVRAIADFMAFNPVFAAQGTTIFTTMSGLAVEHGAVNLGQGFPDEDGPLAVREVASRALLSGPNQYPPMMGMPDLRKAITAHAARFHGLSFDPVTQVLVTSGGTEALTASIMALAGAGDEVVLIEPAYDCYRPVAESIGATVKTIVLAPPNWRLTETALRQAITGKTRLVIINSPLNPIGRVFSRKELELLARVVSETDALVICDEVYEHLVFDGRAHVPLMTLPGMAERVVRVSSAGKIFSLTGWKVGWVTGPAALISVIAKAHQFITFTTSPALQLGVAHGLAHSMDFTQQLTRNLQANRDFLAAGLARIGFDVLPSQGTYFLAAGFSKLSREGDMDFCKRLVREAGVALIPLSFFFSGGKPDTLVRFAFCKKRETLEEALKRLGQYFG
jgi:aspartate/methionine/tyrosine aminotransferase